MKPVRNRLTIFRCSVLLLWGLSSRSFATDTVPEPPPMPKKSTQTESVVKPGKQSDTPPQEKQKQFPKPEVTIRHEGDTRVEEYRVNGRIRYSKIIPSVGAAYYLIDSDGDGIFDERYDDLDNAPINQWILFEW